MKFTFGLNALIGKEKSQQNQSEGDAALWIGDWDLRNAAGLMTYTVFKGYNIDSYELGTTIMSIIYLCTSSSGPKYKT